MINKREEHCLKVALANNFGQLLDYLPPLNSHLDECQPGSRALVPFGKQEAVAMIVRHGEVAVEAEKLRRCIRLLDSEPLLRERDLRLLDWAGNYYLHNPADVFIRALPRGLRSRNSEKPHLHGWKLNEVWKTQSLSLAQKNACEMLTAMQSRADALALASLGVSARTLSSLAKKGIIEPYQPASGDKSLRVNTTLNDEQQHAIDEITKGFGKFAVSLLQGVTGSGKTEVYIHLAAKALQSGRQVLILVPEIGLTPQTLSRFRNALNANIALMHSGLDDTHTQYAWQSMQRGEADVLIGTRSAVLAPCPNLGCIIVDEEHDSSYKQQSGFRYNARDLAIVKGQFSACPVVLGSATPSLTSIYNTKKRGYSHLFLTKRATGIEQPDIELIAHDARNMTVGLAQYSIAQIQSQLDIGKQAMVFINKRGFAKSVYCYNCGWAAMCANCDARMTLHKNPPELQCHHCHSRRKIPLHCEKCASHTLSSIGAGTEQICAGLQRKFPRVPVIRVDQDSIQGKGDLQQRLHEIQTSTPAILVGTQMLAKGHDFPHLALVIALGADDSIYSTDFYSIERTCQLFLQVAGRSGRHGKGKVLIQTSNPRSPYLAALQRNDYEQISQILARERRESALPPYSHMVLLRAESTLQKNIAQHMKDHHAWFSRNAAGIEVFGPFEPTIQRLAKKYRRQILLTGNRNALNALCRRWIAEKHAGNVKKAQNNVRWSIDVDPYDVF